MADKGHAVQERGRSRVSELENLIDHLHQRGRDGDLGTLRSVLVVRLTQGGR